MNNDVHRLLEEGIFALKLGNPKKSKKYFERVLELEPNNIQALLKLGNIFGKIGNYKNAILCYDKILDLEKNLLALINKGLALHYLQNFSKAIECYNLVLKEKPNSVITLYYKASTLIKLNQLDEGLNILQKVIELDYSFKEKAKRDIDFQHLIDNKIFDRMTS